MNVTLALWLAGSALALAPSGPARAADLAAACALAALAALARPGSPAGFAVVVLGCWLVAAPAALHAPSLGPAATDVAVGALAIAAALHPAALARLEDHARGRWRAVRRRPRGARWARA